MSKYVRQTKLLALIMAVGFVLGLSWMPAPALAQPFKAPAGLVSGLFGEKEDLELKDAINYDQCFDYSESFSITFSPECILMYMPWPIPAPVFKYSVNHTEPSAIVELTMEPGGGALQAESGEGDISGQGGLSEIASSLTGGSQTKAYVGNQNPMMPTMGKMPSVYFDAHVWGVGPLGLLEATKGSEGGAKENEVTALESMICWLAEAVEDDSSMNYWLTVPGKASGHLQALKGGAAEGYVSYLLGDWGTRWYNKAGAAQVSATTASSFAGGFTDNAAFSLAALGGLVGHALASGDDKEVCTAKASVSQAKEQAQVNQGAVEESKDQLKSIAPKSTYLPAGYNQVSVGYDTCPITGVGHYINDQTGNISFSNCDPQERIIQLDCNTGQGQFVDSAPGPVTKTMNPYQNPCSGGFHTFADDNYAYVRAPSCHNRLSAFKQDGKYLACNDQSRTYASCGQKLSGSGTMVAGHGSGVSGGKTGTFSLCLQPQGTKVVNHLDEYNNALAENMDSTADAYGRGVEAAGGVLDEHMEKNNIQCETKKGSSGLAGAAAGAAAGYAAGKSLKKLGDAAGGFGDATGGVGDAVGGVTGRIGGAFDNVSGKISESIKGSQLGQQFSEVSGQFKEQFSGLQDQYAGIKEGMQGRLGDLTQGMGLGSLSGITSVAGMITSFNGSLSSMANIAEKMGIMPGWLSSAVSMFNQEKIIPLFISEHNENDWRDENPGSKMARMSLMQNVPLASNAMAFGKNLAGFNCGEVGVWGQLCPLRGFVETSGNNFPASGLAGWRAYHKALPKIPDRKRMIGKPTLFNLDYPHQSACHEVGANPSEWESRSESGPSLFGGAAKGLSSMVSSAAGSLGSMFGAVDDKRAESGVFVYTYWRETKCSWNVCTYDVSNNNTQKILKFDWKK